MLPKKFVKNSCSLPLFFWLKIINSKLVGIEKDNENSKKTRKPRSGRNQRKLKKR